MAEAQHFYQAIGELRGTLVVAEDGTKLLETESARYLAFIPPQVEKKYQDKAQGQQVHWRVYPQFTEQGLAFQVVSVSEQPQKGHGQFVLKGDWVESGQLQIWRNAVAGKGKVNADNWRPRSLPITWSDAPPLDGAFWQLQAELINGTFKVVTAEGPFPHPPRLEKLPESKSQRQELGNPLPKPQLKRGQSVTTESINWEELTSVSGKLELTIKFSTLPQVLKANGECHFKVDCNGRVVQISVKQKQWSKLETASATYPQWVAAIAGQMGAATADGFVLEQPSIQVFERKAKEAEPGKQVKAEIAETVASQQPSAKNRAGAQAIAKTPQAETKPLEKPDSLAKLPAPQAQPEPKKIGKFKVEVR